jgi:hypothetical protein
MIVRPLSGRDQETGLEFRLGVCAVESIPTVKAPQQSIFLFFFVA